MAKDSTQIVCTIAAEAVESTNDFVAALLSLDALNDWRNDAGVPSFVDYEVSIQEMYPHTDGEMFNKILDLTPNIKTYLEETDLSSGGYAGKSYWEMFQMLRDE